MATRPQYFGTIPQIAQAYQNDPRTRLSQSALLAGTSTTPVAQQGWAIPDGLARAAQAMLGAFVNKGVERKYADREHNYMRELQAAAALASQQQPQPVAPPPVTPPNPAMANPANINPAVPPVEQAAAALGGTNLMVPPGRIQTVDPNQAMQAPGGAPSPAEITNALNVITPTRATPITPPTPPPPTASLASASIPPITGGTGPSRGAPAPRQRTQPAPNVDYFTVGIVRQEGGTDRNGNFLTSPLGAIGPAQVMPGTAPEAARLAGLPFDQRRYRTDPEYNLALGRAYYNSHLRTFGDPAKAAAAYNAGPGAVRTAMRRARRSGGSWMDYLPVTRVNGQVVDTTKEYVQRFMAAVSGNGAQGGGQGGGEVFNAPPEARPDVAAPTLEAVPQAPPAPPQQAPGPPQLPGEVVSNRIAMAQQMLQSGNPDLAAMAQTYLDTGLGEQHRARLQQSDQQFAQGQTGYQANLNDWGQARGDQRQHQYGQVTRTEDRNFQRERTHTDQRFTADENWRQRTWQGNENDEQRSWQGVENDEQRQWQNADREDTQTFQAGEARLERESRTDIAGMRAQGRNQFFNSPTGLRMQEELQGRLNGNTNAIDRYYRFLDLNQRQSTGGAAHNTPGVGTVYGWFDPEVGEMRSIANDTTLQNLGGGLGAQISDSDRRFISESNIGMQNPRQTNTNIARARIGALRRQNDYLQEFMNAQADGPQAAAQFAREWSQFAQTAPIVQYDRNGQAVATDQPMTFRQWRESRPRFDANGRRVQ